MTKRSGSMAKLAVLAANAVRNWDLARALELLDHPRDLRRRGAAG